MAAVLEREGYDVRILDCFNRSVQPEMGRPRFLRYGFSDDMILQRVAEYSPDAVGVSCMFTPSVLSQFSVVKFDAKEHSFAKRKAD